MTDVTQILARIESGDSVATEKLLPLTAAFWRIRKLGPTLEPTDKLAATAPLRESWRFTTPSIP
jgi:hypothetical protein